MSEMGHGDFRLFVGKRCLADANVKRDVTFGYRHLTPLLCWDTHLGVTVV